MTDTSYRGNHQPIPDTDPLHELGGPSDGTRGATIPPDVYQHPEFYGWGDDIATHAAVIRRVRGCPDATVRMYRAAPAGVTTINTGDWVAIAESYARQHSYQSDDPADDWPVYYADVPAHTLRTGNGDIMEWGYTGPDIACTVLDGSPS
jgi:hypothetical protein